MKYKNLYLSLSLALLSVSGISAQETVKNMFISAPFDVLPTLSENARLDMIDYYESGLQRPSSSNFGDEVMITEITDNKLRVQTSKTCEITIYAVPMEKDTSIVVIETYSLPFPDSKVSVYNKNWTKYAQIDGGLIDEWQTETAKKGKKLTDIENVISFISASADFEPGTKTLTFTNTSENQTVKDEYKKVAPYLKETRSFNLSQKGFKEMK